MMTIPKVLCECGCTNWELNDGVHECKKCPNKITDKEMLKRLNILLEKKKGGVLKSAG